MIQRKLNTFIKITLVTFCIIYAPTVNAEEEVSESSLTEIKSQMKQISKDLKTLEKAFYKTSEMKETQISSGGLNEDIRAVSTSYKSVWGNQF